MSELQSTGEELQSYGELLQEENRQKERRRKLEEQERLFEIMRVKMAPQTAFIAKISKELETEENEETARRLLAKVAIIGAYIKRRSNLIFLAEQTDADAVEELRLCLSESMASLQLYGTNCAYHFEK